VMSTSFTNQVLAQIHLWETRATAKPGVVVLPKHLDEEVAASPPRQARRQADQAVEGAGRLHRREAGRPVQARGLSLLRSELTGWPVGRLTRS
jgi:hypothetical protein